MDQYLHSWPISTLHSFRQIRCHRVRIHSLYFDHHSFTRLNRIQILSAYLWSTVFDWLIFFLFGTKRMYRRKFQSPKRNWGRDRLSCICFGLQLHTVDNYFKAHNLKIHFKQIGAAAKQHHYEPPGWGSCVQHLRLNDQSYRSVSLARSDSRWKDWNLASQRRILEANKNWLRTDWISTWCSSFSNGQNFFYRRK